MSEIKGNKKIVGKINAKTLRATTTVPDWLQPLIKENGVYVGTEEPTDPEKLVWINPDGEASDLDLSNYYTKDETDSLIDTAVQNIDLSSYATKVELENYDTSEQVDAKINAIEIPEGILHITITDATELLNLETGLYIVDNVFTVNTLQGENGFSGTLSVKKDWYSYTFINLGKALIYNNEDATWNCFLLAYESDIPSIEGLATEDYVNEKIASIPKVDLSGYALKSEIPDVSGFLTAVPEEYVTESELNAKGYLTEHQSLADYSTTTQVQSMIDTAIAGITDGEAVSY